MRAKENPRSDSRALPLTRGQVAEINKNLTTTKNMSTKNQNYVVQYNGEPLTRLSFEGNKANVTTGDIMDAIWYTAEEAAECAAAIGTGAEAVRH
jgi:hypothetical protein